MDDVLALKALCDRHDRLDNPLHLEAPGQPPLRHHVDGRLVGVLTIQAGEPPELCLLVAPEHRRRGIGRHLLADAAAALGGADELLLTADPGSASGRAFAAAVGAVYQSSEYRLELAETPPDRAWPIELTLRPAGPADVDSFERLRASAYGQPDSPARRRRTEAEMRQPHHRYYLAELDGRPVGTIRASSYGESAHVTSFAVARELQGRGLGRQILTRLVRQLAAEGRSPILIEVATDNRGALGLYRSCGFREVAAYDYHALALPLTPGEAGRPGW